MAAHACREKHGKKKFKAINWDLPSNLFSPYKKRINTMLMAPSFLHTLSIHSVCLQRGKATFVSCASVLATVQKCSFVELGSRSVHIGVRNLRPQLLLFVTSLVDYTHSIIQSLNIFTREMTQSFISSLMCHFTDRHAAVIALITNLSFFSSLHPSLCAQEKGGPAVSLLTSLPNNPLGH